MWYITWMNIEIEAAKAVVRQYLGLPGAMISSSKSQYLDKHPEKRPVFNAYVLWQDPTGYLVPVWNGDLELTECQERLLKCAAELKARFHSSNIYIYKESTVHNSTFNGGPFPYSEYCASVVHGQFYNQY